MSPLWFLAPVGALALAAAWMLVQERRPGRILILLYHRLVPDAEFAGLPRPENIFCVAEGRFREQMRFLVRGGWNTLHPDQILAHLSQGAKLPPRPVLVTFDDGSESVCSRALPILRELGLRATVFVTTDPDAWVFKEHSRSQRRLSDDELRRLEAGGVSVQSHGVSHEALNSMPEAEARRELVESRRTLEQVLGKEVRYAAIPLNYYSRRILAMAREAGYRLVFTSDNGSNHARSDPFRLRRVIVEGVADLDEFARVFTPSGMVQRRIVAWLKRQPPRLLGYRLWMPIRSALYRSSLGRVLTARSLRRALLAGAVLLAALALAAWLRSRAS